MADFFKIAPAPVRSVTARGLTSGRPKEPTVLEAIVNNWVTLDGVM
jgi:hypothetical protein